MKNQKKLESVKNEFFTKKITFDKVTGGGGKACCSCSTTSGGTDCTPEFFSAGIK